MIVLDYLNCNGVDGNTLMYTWLAWKMTANKDWWYTDVLRKHQRNKYYIMKLVSVSIVQDNSCFEHTKYVAMGIELVFLSLSHNWILTVNRHLWPFWWAAD